jgi:peptidoglycan/LPS O-acetylase OafA/YrhL
MDMMIENPSQVSQFMSIGEKVILRIAEMFPSIVDTFFVVSGALVCCKCLNLFRMEKFCYWKFVVERFLRFTPALGTVFMFFMSSLPKVLVDGPQMQYMQEEVDECRKSWLLSLLLVSNFHDDLVDELNHFFIKLLIFIIFLSKCLRHTWYTATDFQLFIASPVVIYCLFKYERKFLKVIAFIVLVGQINIFLAKYK